MSPATKHGCRTWVEYNTHGVITNFQKRGGCGKKRVTNIF